MQIVALSTLNHDFLARKLRATVRRRGRRLDGLVETLPALLPHRLYAAEENEALDASGQRRPQHIDRAFDIDRGEFRLPSCVSLLTLSGKMKYRVAVTSGKTHGISLTDVRLHRLDT